MLTPFERHILMGSKLTSWCALDGPPSYGVRVTKQSFINNFKCWFCLSFLVWYKLGHTINQAVDSLYSQHIDSGNHVHVWGTWSLLHLEWSIHHCHTKCHQEFRYDEKHVHLQLGFTIINQGELYTSTRVFLALQCLWYLVLDTLFCQGPKVGAQRSRDVTITNCQQVTIVT